MLQNLQNFANFQKIQLDNLVDFEKCCKTLIFLQKWVPIQPKTNNILPKFCQKLVADERAPRRADHDADDGPHAGAVRDLVQRFDRRGIEPLELFTSEFGPNSLRIEDILLEFIRNPKIPGIIMFNIFYKYLAKFR